MASLLSSSQELQELRLAEPAGIQGPSNDSYRVQWVFSTFLVYMQQNDLEC
jgi:hypothetical protein